LQAGGQEFESPQLHHYFLYNVHMKFVSITRVSQTLITWTKVQMAFITGSILLNMWYLKDLYNLPEGYNPEIDLLTSEVWLVLFVIPHMIVAIITVILLFRWIYHLTKTIIQKHNVPLSSSPRLAVGYYFIPIINLYKPYTHLKEIWHVSNTEKASYNFLKNWWFFSIISTVVGRIIVRGTIDNWGDSSGLLDTQVYIASEAIDLLLAVCTVTLITKFSRAYQIRFGQQETL
jgi:hypothetical protein